MVGSGSTISAWLDDLACPTCSGELRVHGNALECDRGHSWPISKGTIRFTGAGALSDQGSRDRTAETFDFEWERFGVLRDQWEKNFLDYMQPHGPEFFKDLKVLDAGAGSGRHSRQAALYGARVAAVDLGSSIDVARGNVLDDVLTAQTDLEFLPFKEGVFDLVMSIGVLHHLPDTDRALNYLVRFVRPGGRLRIYLYWKPERRWHRTILRVVTAARIVTTRLPHRLLLALCYPLSILLWLLFVGPYSVLRRVGPTKALADALPLKTYADYPFEVLVNDQFDRLSAPLERRYTRDEVAQMMASAGLGQVEVVANSGWVAEGVRPELG